MRFAAIYASIFVLSALPEIIAYSPFNLFKSSFGIDRPRRSEDQTGRLNSQTPMNPGPVQPPEANTPNNQDNGGDSSLTINDILPKTRSINIFASLTRDISSISQRLDSTLPADNTTLLAPLNSAMQKLPRKPWEDRPGDQSQLRAERNEEKAAQNLQKFVEEHIIPVSPWQEGKDGKIKSLGGKEMWWERKDGERFIMPGNLQVDGVVGRVGNGEIWALKGVVNYE